MVVVQPRVSTEINFFISAFFFAILWLPIASDSVTVGRSPSGTLAIIIPMAKIKFSQKVRPIKFPIKKKEMPRDRAITATTLVTLTISRCKGLSASSIPVVRCAIFPNSVFMPVANATASHEPERTLVPAKRILWLSISSSASEGVSLLVLGSDSPVKEALFTRIKEVL